MKDSERNPIRCRNLRLSEDIGLSVFKHDDDHFHCLVALIFPESSNTVWRLLDWVYHVSFKEKMFRWKLESRTLEAEDEAVMDEIDRIRKGEAWRKAALER